VDGKHARSKLGLERYRERANDSYKSLWIIEARCLEEEYVSVTYYEANT
jgi:hypothetical protein